MGNGLIGLAPCIAASWVEWLSQPANWWVIFQVAGGLGFVIFVHELGHFLVAKACGVKCEKFYLGFDVGGAKLCSFKWGETEYGIGALPLGGYVKMLGQDDNPAAAAAEAERARLSGDLPPEPTAGPHPAWDPRSYPAQSVPKRMAIISAGVIMNVIFAVLMASLAFGIGVREMTCEVSSVRPGGAAWRAGLRTGDEITAIGGRKDPIFNDLRHGVTVGSVAKGIDFTVRRPADDTTRTVRIITFASSQKYRNALRGGRAAVSQVDGGRWLTLEGTVSGTDDPARVALAVEGYAARYRQPGEREDRVAVEIAVDRILGRA